MHESHCQIFMQWAQHIYFPHSSRSMHVYTLLQACMHCISYVCIFSGQTCSLFRCCISCSFWATCALSSLLVRNCSPAVKDLCLMCLCTLSANILQEQRGDNESEFTRAKRMWIGTSNSNFIAHSVTSCMLITEILTWFYIRSLLHDKCRMKKPQDFTSAKNIGWQCTKVHKICSAYMLVVMYRHASTSMSEVYICWAHCMKIWQWLSCMHATRKVRLYNSLY